MCSLDGRSHTCMGVILKRETVTLGASIVRKGARPYVRSWKYQAASPLLYVKKNRVL